MKLKYAGILTVISVLFAGTNANAALLDLYAGATIGAGASTLFLSGDDETHSAQSYGGVIGLDIPVFRFELEYDYMQANSVKMHIGMINAYAKLPTPVIQPYLGVGAGNIFSGKDGETELDSVAAYQAMLGVTFNIPVVPLKIDAEGRALYAHDIYNINSETPDFLQYELRLKLRYIF